MGVVVPKDDAGQAKRGAAVDVADGHRVVEALGVVVVGLELAGEVEEEIRAAVELADESEPARRNLPLCIPAVLLAGGAQAVDEGIDIRIIRASEGGGDVAPRHVGTGLSFEATEDDLGWGDTLGVVELILEDEARLVLGLV